MVVSISALVASVFVVQTIFAFTNLSSQVTVGTAAPSVTGVVINGGSPITLVGNATTTVNVTATITDANGCSEITPGTTTILLYRNGSGVSSSTCLTTPNQLNCYQAFAFTASSTCSGSSQTATTTFALQYFAQATDVSSSFSGQKWFATVLFRTPDNTTGTGDVLTGVTLNTTNAINVTTSSINYGTITANSDTGSTNQSTTVANVGNSSTSLQINALSTLVSSSSFAIATSSQGYYTAPFTYPGASTPLTGTAATVAAFTLTSPSSTTSPTGTIYWGLGVPNATPSGTYSGTNVYAALWHA